MAVAVSRFCGRVAVAARVPERASGVPVVAELAVRVPAQAARALVPVVRLRAQVQQPGLRVAAGGRRAAMHSVISSPERPLTCNHSAVMRVWAAEASVAMEAEA